MEFSSYVLFVMYYLFLILSNRSASPRFSFAICIKSQHNLMAIKLI